MVSVRRAQSVPIEAPILVNFGPLCTVEFVDANDEFTIGARFRMRDHRRTVRQRGKKNTLTGTREQQRRQPLSLIR